MLSHLIQIAQSARQSLMGIYMAGKMLPFNENIIFINGIYFGILQRIKDTWILDISVYYMLLREVK